MGFKLYTHKGARIKKVRVGRGTGSGIGKTSGHGHKGQGQRAGSKIYVGFEGNQKPLQRRVPKRGFTNIFRVEYEVINLDKLNNFADNTEITIDLLKEKGLIKKNSIRVKLLSDGELTKKLNIKLQKASKKAIEKVEKAGGKIDLQKA